jgi:hypothetical protein
VVRASRAKIVATIWLVVPSVAVPAEYRGEEVGHRYCGAEQHAAVVDPELGVGLVPLRGKARRVDRVPAGQQRAVSVGVHRGGQQR